MLLKKINNFITNDKFLLFIIFLVSFLLNKNYANIPLDCIPASESLKNTFDRVVPYYEKEIEPLVLLKKNVLNKSIIILIYIKLFFCLILLTCYQIS